MKTVLLVLSLLIASLPAQSGGQYTLDWSTVDGGGVTVACTGGGYTLSGTIGQADAGPQHSGGAFTVTGGFWSLLTVLSVPDAPELTLQFIAGGTRAVLSWPVSTTGWRVEMSGDLQTWTPAPAAIADTDTAHTVTLPAMQRAFYRLAPAPTVPP